MSTGGFNESMLSQRFKDDYQEFRDAFEKVRLIIVDQISVGFYCACVLNLNLFLSLFDAQCVDRQKVQPVTPELALNESWSLLRTLDLYALVAFEDIGEELKPLVNYKIRQD